MDHHVGGAERLADIKPLPEPAPHNVADQRVVGGKRQVPERAVNAEAAGIAGKQVAGMGDRGLPVAFEQRRLDEILQFEVALALEDPVMVAFEIGDIHRGADHRQFVVQDNLHQAGGVWVAEVGDNRITGGCPTSSFDKLRMRSEERHFVVKSEV